LNIETTNACNARCCFCAYRKSRRKKEEMPIDLYEKIVAEYAEMGGGALLFTPITGDFFLDSKCIERIKIARKYSNIATISATTNGIALNHIGKDNWKELLRDTDFLQFSVGGLDRAAYRRMFGVDKFDTVLTNIVEFAQMRNKIRASYPLRLIFRTSEKKEIVNSPLLKELEALGYEILVDNSFGNWGGLISKEDLPNNAILKQNIPYTSKRSPCFVFFLGLCITSSGLASACGCMNSEAIELIVGDLKHESLKSVWNNKKYQKLKASFGSKAMPSICKKCSQYESGHEFSTKAEVLNFKPGRYPFGY